MRLATSASVKVFGCRPMMTPPRTRGRRPQTSKGGNRGRCGEASRQTLWGFRRAVCCRGALNSPVPATIRDRAGQCQLCGVERTLSECIATSQFDPELT
jgi:hypothetical protein